jgi:hypothetical protein
MIPPASAKGQDQRARRGGLQHRRNADREARADETFDRLLAAIRRGSVHQTRRLTADLASLGYAVEPVEGTHGVRLSDTRGAHL